MTTKKIGVVQMDKLVYDYKGMKEATSAYEKKMKRWGGETDSLEQKLKTLYAEIRIDSLRQDKKELIKDLQEFEVLKNGYMICMKQIQTVAVKEDEEMTSGVINQVNSYIKEFAEKKGYDVILCNNVQQSVGHVKEGIDITKEVLDYANTQYAGIK